MTQQDAHQIADLQASVAAAEQDKKALQQDNATLHSIIEATPVATKEGGGVGGDGDAGEDAGKKQLAELVKQKDADIVALRAEARKSEGENRALKEAVDNKEKSIGFFFYDATLSLLLFFLYLLKIFV
jgi:hypothetical protein